MVAYSFKARFAPPILDGTKDQTIRGPRKSRHARPGEALQLFVGMRTKNCRLIGRTHCADVLPCRLVFAPVIEFEVGGERIRDLDAFARRDGFADVQDMARFWMGTHRLAGARVEFGGTLVRWRPLTGEAHG